MSDNSSASGVSSFYIWLYLVFFGITLSIPFFVIPLLAGGNSQFLAMPISYSPRKVFVENVPFSVKALYIYEISFITSGVVLSFLTRAIAHKGRFSVIGFSTYFWTNFWIEFWKKYLRKRRLFMVIFIFEVVAMVVGLVFMFHKFSAE